MNSIVAIRKRFPQAMWIHGSGRYATLAWCGDYRHLGYKSGLTVELQDTLEKAKEAKKHIDNSGCGYQCRGSSGHQIWQFVNGIWITYQGA